jgi:DNA-binding NarL/FixJ family response regulator
MNLAKTPSCRIIIVDDDELVREALALYLNSIPGCKVIGGAGTGPEAIKLCEKEKPDLILLDAIMPELHGLEVLKTLAHKRPTNRFLVLTGSTDESLPVRFLREGAHGFIRKGESLEIFRDAIHTVRKGGFYFMSKDRNLVQNALKDPVAVESLTSREREILQLIAESHATKEIAAKLGLSIKTAESHRANLMQKLNIHDVAGLTRYAIRHGMIKY